MRNGRRRRSPAMHTGSGRQHRLGCVLRAALSGLRLISPRRRLSRVQAYLRGAPTWRQQMHSVQYQSRGALDAQDVAYATLLSELVYRAAECNDDASFHRARAVVEAELGASLQHLRHHKAGGQRYLVGESADAIFVAFQGTKHATDWLANLTFFHAPLWNKHSSSSKPPLAGSRRRRISSSSSSSISSSSSSARAHVGFIKRANQSAQYITALHEAAAASGRRLVLTGHSLGGAVATLTTVRLLRSLALSQPGCSSGHEGPAALSGCQLAADPRVRCISFATPAVANTDLLQEVSQAGWDRYITNILIPEDNVVPVVNALLKAPTSPVPAAQLSPFSKLPLGSLTAAACGGFCRHDSSSSNKPSLKDLADLQYEPLRLPEAALLCSGTITAAHSSALQPPRSQPSAVSGFPSYPEAAWQVDFRFAEPRAAVAMTGVGSLALASQQAAAAGAATVGMGGSAELQGWLAAADGAIAQRQRRRQQQLQRNVSDGSVAHSSSELSLCSLQSSVAESSSWASSGSACNSKSSSSDGSLGSLTDRLEASLLAASAAAVSFLTGGASSAQEANQHDSSYFSDPGIPTASSGVIFGAAAAVAGTVVAAAAASQPAASQTVDGAATAAVAVAAASSKRLPRLGLSKAKLAWITGAVAAGVRCAAALTAPQFLGAHAGPLLSLPRALIAPFSLAALHLVGSAAIKAALPVSHPLGQQWVLTGKGLEVVARPLPAYPRDGDALKLKELGGFCPGHRMIAYRRRVVALLDEGHFQ